MPEESTEQSELQRLRSETRRLTARVAELDFLAELAEWLEKHTSLEELHQMILDRLADRLGARMASLMMLDGNSGELSISAARGLTEGVIGSARVKVGQGISGHVAASGRALVIKDIEKAFGRPNREGYQTPDCLSVPLKFRGQVLGVLNFAEKREGVFGDADLEMVSRLGRQAAGVMVAAMSHQVLIQQERFERDLQFAHTLQEAFLPGRPPEIEGLMLAARYVPALEVGGDFYDFIHLPDGRVGVVIGDVSGKGIPAALFMARFSSDFRALALAGLSPGEVMSRAARIVSERSRRGLFVTAVYVVIDPGGGQAVLSNAGHPAPLVRSADQGSLRSIEEGVDVPLGVLAEVEYPEARFSLAAGEALLLLTDGVLEARAPGGGRYGAERLNAAVGRETSRPREMIERVLGEVVRFAGMGAQSDDLTIVAAGRPA